MAGLGKPKTGGRKKGTPNKVGGSFKESIADILSFYSDPEQGITKQSLLKQDLLCLEPKDRIWAIAKLAEFCMPKMQAVALSTDEDKTLTIENKLVELAKEKDSK